MHRQNVSASSAAPGHLNESEVPLKGAGTDCDEEYDAMYIKPVASPRGDDAEDLYSKPEPVATKGVTPRRRGDRVHSVEDVFDEEDDMEVVGDLKPTPNGNPFLMEMEHDDGEDEGGFEYLNEENPFIEQ